MAPAEMGQTGVAGGVNSQTCSCDLVLVAEDDPVYRHVLASRLQAWGYRVTAVRDGNAAWQVLQNDEAPSLLVLDWVMPGIEGPELCRRVREQQRTPYPYILLITAKDEKGDIVRGLEAGADDYLTKPFVIAELRARIAVGKRILELQNELIRAREELRFRATHDALTGLWNRAAILSLLAREMQQSARDRSSVGVMMVDIDHFKKVNDTYGHLSGDIVLRDVARRIGQAVRAYDLVGRYGGEEFLVVLSGCDSEELRGSAERVRLAVADIPVALGTAELHATVTVGAAAATAYAATEQDLIARADAALYLGKRSGRNRVEIETAVCV